MSSSFRRLPFLMPVCLAFLSAAAGAQTASEYYPPPQQAPLQFVEQMPVFDGNLDQFLAEHIHYPDSSRDGDQQGRVVVEFIVLPSGLIRGPRVVRSATFPLLDWEAMRLVRIWEASPHWKPGRQADTAVPVRYVLPITFRLD